MTKIIAITGVTAAGKTTLAKNLASNIQATIIGWDDFDSISEGPEDYVDWYKRGQNFDEWNYEALAQVLLCLKGDKPIIHPTLDILLAPTEYIIFDAPLGFLHRQTGQYIDVCVHIELPLDVSLSRRLLRDFKGKVKTKDELLEELKFYLLHSRPLYFDDALKLSANLVVDGMLATEAQVNEIKRYLNGEENEK